MFRLRNLFGVSVQDIINATRPYTVGITSPIAQQNTILEYLYSTSVSLTCAKEKGVLTS